MKTINKYLATGEVVRVDPCEGAKLMSAYRAAQDLQKNEKMDQDGWFVLLDIATESDSPKKLIVHSFHLKTCGLFSVDKHDLVAVFLVDCNGSNFRLYPECGPFESFKEAQVFLANWQPQDWNREFTAL